MFRSSAVPCCLVRLFQLGGMAWAMLFHSRYLRFFRKKGHILPQWTGRCKLKAHSHAFARSWICTQNCWHIIMRVCIAIPWCIESIQATSTRQHESTKESVHCVKVIPIVIKSTSKTKENKKSEVSSWIWLSWFVKKFKKRFKKKSRYGTTKREEWSFYLFSSYVGWFCFKEFHVPSYWQQTRKKIRCHHQLLWMLRLILVRLRK